VLGAHVAEDGVHLALSNERKELLDAASVRVHGNGSWTCINSQGLTARFTRQAQMALMECVEEDAAGYLLRVGGSAWPLKQVD